MKRYAVAIILGPEKLMLMGTRRDNGLWTCPAGKIEDGEDAIQGCVREVKEETGLDVEEAHLVSAGVNSQGNLIYCFLCRAKGQIDTTKDPDQECAGWTWEDPFDRAHEMHVPKEDNAAVRWYAQHYDLLRSL